MKFKMLILGVLLVSCGKSDFPVDDNVTFYDDDRFMFYDDLVIDYEDSEMLDDESLMITGYTDTRDQAVLLIDSSRSNTNMQLIDNQTSGLFYHSMSLLVASKGYMSHVGTSLNSFVFFNYRIFLRRLNSNGSAGFSIAIGDNLLNQQVISHIQLPNEDFIILSMDVNPQRTFYIHRVTEEGDIIFSRSYLENIDLNRFAKLKYLPEDNSILVLNVLRNSVIGEDAVARITILDDTGDIKRTNDIILNRDIRFSSYDIIVQPDGSLIFYCSVTLSSNSNDYHMKIMKLDSDLNIAWDKEFSNIEPNGISDLTVSNNNDILILSHSRDIGEGELDIILSRLDSDGNIKWRSVIGSNSSEIGSKIYEKENGNILVLGSQDNGFGTSTNFRFFILETDSNGTPI